MAHILYSKVLKGNNVHVRLNDEVSRLTSQLAAPRSVPAHARRRACQTRHLPQHRHTDAARRHEAVRLRSTRTSVTTLQNHAAAWRRAAAASGLRPSGQRARIDGLIRRPMGRAATEWHFAVGGVNGPRRRQAGACGSRPTTSARIPPGRARARACTRHGREGWAMGGRAGWELGPMASGNRPATTHWTEVTEHCDGSTSHGRAPGTGRCAPRSHPSVRRCCWVVVRRRELTWTCDPACSPGLALPCSWHALLLCSMACACLPSACGVLALASWPAHARACVSLDAGHACELAGAQTEPTTRKENAWQSRGIHIYIHTHPHPFGMVRPILGVAMPPIR